jgi:hypothetical protein
MDTGYQETVEKSFKDLKFASLLTIIEMILGIAFTIFVMYIVVSIALIAVSKNVIPGTIDNYIIHSILSNNYLILILAAFYVSFVGIAVYSLYLYSKSIALLSPFNRSLEGPAKFSKYLYLIILIIDIFEIFYIDLELNSMPDILLSISYIVLTIGVLLLVLYLYIGIYRIGVIYDNSSVRLAAIFYFIPLLDIVAPFLLYSGSKKLLETYKQK